MNNRLNLNQIKNSSLNLAQVSEKRKNVFLSKLVELLKSNKEEIRKANEMDIKKAINNKLPSSFVDRLALDDKGLSQLVLKLKDLQKLNSQIGSTLEEKIREDGLILKKVITPIGVILIIFESRPEVTIDVAALCIKSGNTAILKGGSEAIKTNKVLYKCILQALQYSNLPKESINLISTRNRKVIHYLLKKNDYIDLVIARGGYNLVRNILNKSTIPVLAHAAGGARIYIDKSANLSIVEKIIINAKINKPAACNSLDTIVVHKEIAPILIPGIVRNLRKQKIKIVGDEKTKQIIQVNKAGDRDWCKEYLSLTVSIKVVNDLNEAIVFINKYSKRHSEGIIATDKKVINLFCDSIDAASIFINSSTRLHDGYEFGLGAEIGIATGKLHARGPVGLKELMTYKWIIEGNGHVRK